MSRWDGVVATSFIRLVAARPHAAADVEASDPDIIMRRCATSERTMTPAKTSTSPGDLMPKGSISRARAVSATRTSSDGASTTTVPWASSEM
jgi:hypothetical protein